MIDLKQNVPKALIIALSAGIYTRAMDGPQGQRVRVVRLIMCA